MKRLVIKDKEGIKKKIQDYFVGNEEARFIHRLHGVLLFSEKEDESCDSIGALFGNSPRTVSNWINRINATGDIESLRSKKQPGRPSSLSEKQRQELQEVIQESPEKHGITINISAWLKFAQTVYSDDRTYIGSGRDKINGNRKTDLKIQIRWKF